MKISKRKKETAENIKQSLSNQDLDYLKKYAENSAIVAFSNRKPSKQQ